jgi:DmsE family decaheme c-type cytochrome
MRFRTLLLGPLFLGLFLCAPQLPAKSKSKPAHVEKHARDFQHFVEVSGAEKVGATQCRACHEDLAKRFTRTRHSLDDVACEQCHGAGSLHVAEGAYSKDKIISFRDRPAEEANGVCLSCHAESDHVRNWFAGAHQAQGLKCSDCHTIHGEMHGDQRALESRRQQNDRCLGCHKKQDAESSLPYHHPIREAKMSCVDCHDPHGGSAGNNLISANVNDLCFSCHAEYQGPFSYQHPPVNEGCMKCHSAHGSPNQNLLAVSQPALCLQCHAAHHNGAGVPLADRCTNCHNAIHGSDTPSATGGSVFMDK